MSSCLDGVQVKRRVTHGLYSRDYNGKVIWFAAGHDGVDGQFLYRSRAPIRWYFADYFLRVDRHGCQHSLHSVGGRRNNGQTISPASC